MGVGSVNGDRFDDEHSRAMVVHYDAMGKGEAQNQLGSTSRIGSTNWPIATAFPWCSSPKVLGTSSNFGRRGGRRVGIDTTMFAEFAN